MKPGPEIASVVTQCIRCVTSEMFASYTKEFAEKMSSALQEGYYQGLKEPDIVKLLVSKIRGHSAIDTKNQIEIVSNSVFIHGNQSQVKFSYYGNPAQTELGDLIFIVSVIYNGRKYFERLTINQVKKDKMRESGAFWDLSSKDQLYLLSRFPTFEGVSGSIVPPVKCSLPDYSAALGSYGLLYRPGDFAFVSAPRLETYVQSSMSLKFDQLPAILKFAEETTINLTWAQAGVLVLTANQLLWPYLWSLFGNHHAATNVFDFAQKYLAVGIGEYTFTKVGFGNPSARSFLDQLLSKVLAKAIKKGQSDIEEFVKRFSQYPFAENGDESDPHPITPANTDDLEGGGIGIVHTTINLGERSEY